MFDRFDERAYRAVACAGIEARDRHYGHVGTESLLMGLLLEANERAGTSNASSDLVKRVREVIGQRVSAGPGSDPEARVIELTPRARQVLERAAYQAAERAGTERLAGTHLVGGCFGGRGRGTHRARCAEHLAQRASRAPVRVTASLRAAGAWTSSSSR